MSFRLVDGGWDRELVDGLQAEDTHVRMVSPFIKKRALERLLSTERCAEIQVVTRFNLRDFAKGVSDLGALRVLLEEYGARVRGVRNLHAKLYVFDKNRAIVTSANLTEAALLHNHELGFVAEESALVQRCIKYFEDLWSRAGSDLTLQRLASWETKIRHHLASGARPDKGAGLGDEGTDVGAAADEVAPPPWILEAPQAFVKFLGEGDNRVALSYRTLEEVQRAGCHWAVAYPSNKRPTGVEEGAIIFIGRLTEDPNDIRVFGRAIGMRYELGRDDATADDIALRSWKRKWPHYIRVHHAEFVSGNMANGVSLNALMDALKTQSFASTQRNAALKAGNTDPRKAYRQQPAVELSREGFAWLNDRLETSLALHGKLAPTDLAALDWPDVRTARAT